MFDALNKDVEVDDTYNSFVPSPTYYELMEVTKELEDENAFFMMTSFQTNMSSVFDEDSFSTFADMFAEETRESEERVETPVDEPDIFAAFHQFASFALFDTNVSTTTTEPKKKTTKKRLDDQVDLFDFLAV